MADEPISHVFEYEPGDWWAECLVCSEWVCVHNDSKRKAEQQFGRHFQNDHPDAAAERRAR
jgi:hypothetical protein